MSKVFLAHCEWDDDHAAKVRRALRREMRANPDALKNDLEADCIVEQVWNAMVGLDKKPKR